jgi:hypothetical protein
MQVMQGDPIKSRTTCKVLERRITCTVLERGGREMVIA